MDYTKIGEVSVVQIQMEEMVKIITGRRNQLVIILYQSTLITVTLYFIFAGISSIHSAEHHIQHVMLYFRHILLLSHIPSLYS